MLCESQARETEAYDALVTGSPKKQELARRLLTLLRIFHQPPPPGITSHQNATGGLSMGPPAPRLVLQPGELDKVNEFLSTLRSGVQAPTQPLTATAQHRSVVLTTPDASDAASPSPWSSFMSSAGVGTSSASNETRKPGIVLLVSAPRVSSRCIFWRYGRLDCRLQGAGPQGQGVGAST